MLRSALLSALLVSSCTTAAPARPAPTAPQPPDAPTPEEEPPPPIDWGDLSDLVTLNEAQETEVRITIDITQESMAWLDTRIVDLVDGSVRSIHMTGYSHVIDPLHASLSKLASEIEATGSVNILFLFTFRLTGDVPFRTLYDAAFTAFTATSEHEHSFTISSPSGSPFPIRFPFPELKADPSSPRLFVLIEENVMALKMTGGGYSGQEPGTTTREEVEDIEALAASVAKLLEKGGSEDEVTVRAGDDIPVSTLLKVLGVLEGTFIRIVLERSGL